MIEYIDYIPLPQIDLVEEFKENLISLWGDSWIRCYYRDNIIYFYNYSGLIADIKSGILFTY